MCRRIKSISIDMQFTILNGTLIVEPFSAAFFKKAVIFSWGLCVFIFALCYRCIYRRLRLIWYIRKIPGPMSIPILGTTWQFEWKINRLTRQFMHWYIYYKRKNVDLIRIWLGPFPIVAAFSAEGLRAILESPEVISKGDEYSIVKRWLGTGLLISDGQKWRSRRKLLTPAFHFNALRRYQSIHDREAKIFVREIQQFANTNKTFDAYPFLKRLALDIICSTSMGVKVNAQTIPDHPYVEAVRKLNKLSFAFIKMPFLWFKPIWYAMGYGFDYDDSLKTVTDFTREVIADRRREFQSEEDEDTGEVTTKPNGEEAERRKRYDFLDILLDAQKQADVDSVVTDEDIREEVDTFLFEGHDTTSSGMAWAIWSLACHPECQRRVIEEVDRVFGDSDRDCTTEDLKELKYLGQCVKEALRLYPPVPFFSRKVKRDFECLGYTIPRGTTLLVAPAAVHMDGRHFPNPMVYNPDNFDHERTAKRHPFAFIPFSAGYRNCIGQKFAMMEEKTVLAWFFRYYRCSARIPFKRNMPCLEIINKPHRGVPIVLEQRRPIPTAFFAS
ncbi:hypothetical protein M3Y99_01461300 [Aphelenchoides fujianensis]|nr:hypothetical protein M3Y99_01461300 [Aphelenchoides fujianensis]